MRTFLSRHMTYMQRRGASLMELRMSIIFCLIIQLTVTLDQSVFAQVRTVPEFLPMFEPNACGDFSETDLSVGSVVCLTEFIELTEMTFVCWPPGGPLASR